MSGPSPQHDHPNAAGRLVDVGLVRGCRAGRRTRIGVAVALALLSASGCGGGDSPPPPPNPTPLEAPPVDPTVATSLLNATRFLYTGSDRVQTGLDPGTIDGERVAVMRGRVLERGGGVVAGVRVFVLGHPEFGETRTREDGFYDLVVNGGGHLTLRFLHDDFLESQRTVPVAWSNYTVLEDVLLVRQDSRVTPIDLAVPAVQVARGSVVTDSAGSRQATLLFPPGTSAEMVLPGGSRQPLGSFRLRATEYTVGPDGPDAMPAALPPTSAYTYAVELGVEEAMAAGAIHVAFGSPVPFYVENFLGIPVGGVVPVGSYDRERGVWVPQEDGLVLGILSIAGGLAELDLDGGGVAATSDELADVGITDPERRELASLYSPGQSVWRAPLSQFSPIDLNYFRRLEPDSQPPDVGFPDGDAISSDPCCAEGSIIEIENQVLGESIPLVGTPFSLNYRSNWTPGRRRSLRMRVSGPEIPASLHEIELKVTVAGRVFEQTLLPEANRVAEVVWDGLDAYGRRVQGTQVVEAEVSYVYPLQYRIRMGSPESRLSRRDCGRGFGAYFVACDDSTAVVTIPGRTTGRSQKMTFLTTVVSPWDARGQGELGGWTLDVHHSYDVSGKTLRLGSGTQLDRSATPVLFDLHGDALAELKASISSIAVGPDGSLYLADFDAGQVLRLPPQGAPRLYAGFQGPDDDPPEIPGDIEPIDVAVGPDGSVYLAEFEAIWKVEEGSLIRIAGAENPGSSDLGLGFPAVDANLELDADNKSLAVGPDQTVYFTTGDKLLSVGTDGILRLVAGGGSLGSDDGILASDASAADWSGLTVGVDGFIYVAVGPEHRIRRIGPDGIISTVAGGTQGFSGDGGPAVDCALEAPVDVALHPEGGFVIADSGNFRIRLVSQSGIIRTLAGNGGGGLAGDGRPPAAEGLSGISSVAVGPDGSIYVACFYGDFLTGVGKILRVRAQPPTAAAGNLLVAGPDGAEIYEFDPDGRHLRTWDSLTSAMLYEFTYDAAGRLAGVRDSFNNLTSIRRDALGRAEAILAPHGQETLLSHDANGYLASVANPAMETTRMAYDGEKGLLTQFTDPRGSVHRFTYDAFGLLIRDEDPAGKATLLARTTFEGGHEVLLTSPEGRTFSVRVESLPEGGRKVTETTAGTIQTVTVVEPDGKTTRTLPDGRVITETLGPDPRWQMQAPLVTERVETTPAGRESVLTMERLVELGSDTDPLSLTRLEDRETSDGLERTRIYDGSSRTLTTTTPESRTEIVRFDEQGRTVATQNGGLETVRFAYDARGRLASAEQGSGATLRRATFTYDAAGNLVELGDALGRLVRFAYDAAGRRTAQTGGGGDVVAFAYDAAGNLVTLSPPGRPAHRFTHTASDLLHDYEPPPVAGGGKTSHAYDDDRELVRVDQPGGRTILYAYNEEGSIQRVSLDRGDITFEYDEDTDSLTLVRAPQGVDVSYAHDGPLVTSMSWAGPVAGSVETSYDDRGRTVSRSVNGADELVYDYDADDLVAAAGDLEIARTAADGRVASTTLDSIETSWEYNGFGEPSRLLAKRGAATLLEIVLTRDARGRMVQKQETIGGATETYAYFYDAAGRLSEVTRDGTRVEAYAYDANGNRTSAEAEGGATKAGTYDDQDRMLTWDGGSYVYTANGELRSRADAAGTTTLDYDGIGNLTGVVLPDGTQIEYLVDGLNRRVGRRVNGTLVQGFLYEDALRPVAEMDGSGNVVSRFVFATRPNVPDYMTRDGRTYRIVSDHLGSPRLVVDAGDGTIVQRLRYDAFGRVLEDTNPGFQPFGFAGGLADGQTGLLRFGARDYDPAAGRWTSRDPTGFEDGSNLYQYVKGDPLNFRDPRGTNRTPASSAAGDSDIEEWFNDVVCDCIEGIRDQADEWGVKLPPEVDNPLRDLENKLRCAER